MNILTVALTIAAWTCSTYFENNAKFFNTDGSVLKVSIMWRLICPLFINNCQLSAPCSCWFFKKIYVFFIFALQKAYIHNSQYWMCIAFFTWSLMFFLSCSLPLYSLFLLFQLFYCSISDGSMHVLSSVLLPLSDGCNPWGDGSLASHIWVIPFNP